MRSQTRRKTPSSRKVNGDADGTRELIDVLLLHRFVDPADVEAGITAALQVGAVSADVVAVEARRHSAENPAGGSTSDRHHGEKEKLVEHRVVSLTQRRLTDPAAVIAGLPPDKRPMPSVAGYDELLAKRNTAPNPARAVPVSKENIS